MPSSQVVRTRTRTPATSKRTTPKKVKGDGGDFDIDAALAQAGVVLTSIYDDVADEDCTSVHLFGEDFRIAKGVNLLALGDATSEEDPNIVFFFKYFHPDDLGRFKEAYARVRDLNGDALQIIIRKILAAASSPNPTKPASDSGRTATKATSRQLSAAN